jgi:ketosteroid isomerase-like protein
MSEENVEVVRRMFEAYARGGFVALAEFTHPDFEMTQVPNHPLTGPFRATEAAEVMLSFAESFEDFRAEPEDFVDAGDDRVVVAFRERGRPRGGSLELDQVFGILYTLRGDKIFRMEWFDTFEEALAATDRDSALD